MISAAVAETNHAEVAEKDRERLNAISGQIVDSAMRVHTVDRLKDGITSGF